MFLTVAGLSPDYGGPSRSIPALAGALAQLGNDVRVLACEPFASQEPPLLPDAKLVPTTLLPSRARRWQWLDRSNEFARALDSARQHSEATVIHDNGLWLPTNHAVSGAAQRLGWPLVISPRGMLTGWSRQHGRLRKQIAWCLFQHRDLNRAALIHCTSVLEARELDALGLKPPIAIVPNGVDVPDAETLSRLRSLSRPERTALFLSRIHPKKGLPNLLHAWAKVRPPGWRLLIVGSDEAGHADELRGIIRGFALDQEISLRGPADGEAKWQLYVNADLFVFPSHSENFGIVVAEALACGLPVITTKGTPWQELVETHCGWWADIGVEPLAAALKQAVQLSDDQRRDMGRRGQDLVRSKYTWEAAARQLGTAYQWITRKGERPACVVSGTVK